MSKTNLFLTILTICTISVYSQEVQIGFGSGIGSYSMSDLKGLNNKISIALPFEKKIVSDFPPYWYYQLSAVVNEKKIGFGICYNFESTGSRIASQDYSGEYKFDMKIYSNTPSFYGEYNFNIINDLRFGLYSMAGYQITHLDVIEYLRIREKTIINKSYKFDAKNVVLHPGIEINYQIRLIGFKLNAGYLFQGKSDSFSKNNDPDGSPYVNLYPLKPDWGGYRICFSIIYSIVIKNSNNANPKPKNDDSNYIHKR